MRTSTWLRLADGWSLFWLLTGAVGVLVATSVLAVGGTDGLRLGIRETARTSLVLFLLAFTASAAVQLAPNGWTRWQRRNRRMLGLAFATSHFLHLGLLVGLASVDTALFWSLTNPTTIATAGLAYVFIAAMAATSFPRSAALLGPRAWRVLHWAGSAYVWISFAVAFGKRVPLDAAYALPVALLLGGLALRIAARAGTGSPGLMRFRPRPGG
ncbi:hypothetical protein [Zavarzinia sp. CC-PAN008]|uniref:hypothetical protein n=1 Tax=Zavarzinia sp. CC-PAN008 TaxID=3243332 RepID=UPI003F7432B6